MSVILNKISQIVKWRAPNEASLLEQLHYYVMNMVGFILLFAFSVGLIGRITFYTKTNPTLNLVMVSLMIPVYVLVYLNKINLARFYLIISLNVSVFLLSTHRNMFIYNFHVLFLATSLLPILLFSTQERIARFFGIGLSSILLFIGLLNNFNFPWSFDLPQPIWSIEGTFALTLSLILVSVYLVIQFHDMTLKYLDEERTRMINTDKLVTLGELSSSLAHELKNPLAVILSRASLLVEQMEYGPIPQADLEKSLAVILRTGGRIEQNIKSIQALSRDSTRDNLSPIPLKVLLDDVSILLDHKFKAKETSFKVVTYHPQWQVMGRESQLVQVMMNLISNAIDAIDNLEERWVEVEFIKNDKNFIIQIKDSGSGIASDIIEKIMTPFYTTKVSGKGTGLGLSISRRIMKDHDGDLVYVPNMGNTVFQMLFPLKHFVHNERKDSLAA